jgi:serine/threonine protein phosphatase PrpC
MTVLRSGSATDVGRVRKINQDLPLEAPNLYAVADGMGGHVGGEVAARVAI